MKGHLYTVVSPEFGICSVVWSSDMISRTVLLTLIVLGSLLLQSWSSLFDHFKKLSDCRNKQFEQQKKLQARALHVEGLLTLRTTNSSETSRNGTYRIQIQDSGKDILVTEEATSKRQYLEELCPEDSDCEEFLESIKYFIIEFVATFAGLSWGAWSNLVFSFNQINS